MPVPRGLLLAPLLVGLAGCADDPAPSGWRSLTVTDSGGATRGVLMALDADDPPKATSPPTLYVRCEGGATSLFVDWRADLGADTVAVTYALDGGERVTEPWEAASGRTAVGRWTDSLAVPLLRRLAAHRALDVEVAAADSPRAASFDVRGLSEAAGPLRSVCPEAIPPADPSPDR